MNTFAGLGIITMLIALWIGQGQPYPHNGFAVGVFATGAVLLLISGWLEVRFWAWRWEREDRRDEERAAQEDAGAAFGGQWE